MKNKIPSTSNLFVIILTFLILVGTSNIDFNSTCLAQSPWTKKADMPTGRWELSTCVVDGKIFAIGGAIFLQAVSIVEVYDPATDTWFTKSDMPTARQALSTSVVNGKIYAIGGGLLEASFSSGKSLSTVEEYDPACDKWTKKSEMPNERGWHSSIVLDGKIYIIGGCDTPGGPSMGKEILTVDVYDPVADSWSQKGNIPDRIGAGFTSLVDRKIYVFGGYWGLNKIREYDPTSDTCIEKTDMPTGRCGLSTSLVDRNIYAIGGHPGSSPYTALATVEAYNPLTDTWQIKSDMLIGRCGVSTSVVNGKIYAFGGYIDAWGGPMCVTVEEYDPSKDSSDVKKMDLRKLK